MFVGFEALGVLKVLLAASSVKVRRMRRTEPDSRRLWVCVDMLALQGFSWGDAPSVEAVEVSLWDRAQ